MTFCDFLYWLSQKLVLLKNLFNISYNDELTQPVITCLKLTIETLEQDVKYVQS